MVRSTPPLPVFSLPGYRAHTSRDSAQEALSGLWQCECHSGACLSRAAASSGKRLALLVLGRRLLPLAREGTRERRLNGLDWAKTNPNTGYQPALQK